ncbi:MAG: hypothetical protein ACT4PL_13715, partial [Phycisphaerales bacterium]
MHRARRWTFCIRPSRSCGGGGCRVIVEVALEVKKPVSKAKSAKPAATKVKAAKPRTRTTTVAKASKAKAPRAATATAKRPSPRAAKAALAAPLSPPVPAEHVAQRVESFGRTLPLPAVPAAPTLPNPAPAVVPPPPMAPPVVAAPSGPAGPRILPPGPPPPMLTWPPPKADSWPSNLGPPVAKPSAAHPLPPGQTPVQRPPIVGRGPGFNQQQRPAQTVSQSQSYTPRPVPPAPTPPPAATQPPALEGLPSWAIPRGPSAQPPAVPPPPQIYQQAPSAPRPQHQPYPPARHQPQPQQPQQQQLRAPHAWNNQRPERAPPQPPAPPRRKFEDLITIDPQPRLTLEYPGCPDSCRLIDLFCPIGRGQRALIVSPPKAGKTTLLKDISESIARNNPELELIALLVDERPEEVTDFKRHFEKLGPKARVIASSNDHGVEKHIQVSIQTMTDCKRAVEEGRHIVVVLDSLTRLGRAFNLSRRHASSGRTMSGGLDARALEVPRQIFGAARNTEDGGSLTIIATCLVDTGSRGDEVIFEEFKG